MQRGIFGIKKTCASAQVGVRRSVRRAYLRNSPINTSGISIVTFFGRNGPAGKRKGVSLSATEVLRFSLSVTTPIAGKKTCASAQAGVSKVVNVTLTPPINTSGRARISTGSREQTSEHSQQRIAKCKQRFVFPCAGFNYRSRQCKQVTDKPALNHICAIPSPPRG